MKRFSPIVVPVVALLLSGIWIFHPSAQFAQDRGRDLSGAKGQTAFRIVFGIGDKETTVWDGSVSPTSARITGIRGFNFGGKDTIDGKSSWTASTRPATQSGAQRRSGRPGHMSENGVLLTSVLDSPDANFDIKTKQGSFSFRASDLPYGKSKTVVDGRVRVDRVPCTRQLTTSQEEEDFPAIAQSGDDVWVAFVRFKHSNRARESDHPFQQEPASFDYLAGPAGGDQILLKHYSKSKNAWENEIPVSAEGQDVMRTAVAVDGRNRVWVIWSANQKGNFDLYARSYSEGKWSAIVRLTSDAGMDVNPVAVTDSTGRVWVAWQGFRNRNLEILASVQQGDKFSPEKIVSFSPRSDWDPAIAAASNGEVAVSWDTYDKGDYDVYFRRLRASGQITMEPAVPVAASQNFEARSSIAFDAHNRLWVAYEASFKKWGKDFGAYESTGVALYQGHNTHIKCFQGNSAFSTEQDVSTGLPGVAAIRGAVKRRDAKGNGGVPLPNPEYAKNRDPDSNTLVPPMALNSFPRITADSSGNIYLAVRTPGGNWRSPVGPVWYEYVLYYDGAKWTGPIFVPGTDGLLDGRPALAALAPGRLMIVSAMDHRQPEVAPAKRDSASINSDLYAADLRIEPQGQPAKLKPLPAETVAAPDPEAKPEIDQVAMLRNYRTQAGSQKLQLMRGEFHRHTEYSMDGSLDGPLIDAYRYMIDSASMDWVGCCDHDNGDGKEYSWWIAQKLTDAYHLGGNFVPMFSYERSVAYPEGHRNVVFAQRGVRTLPRLPRMATDSAPSHAPDTQMLYRYLRRFGGIVASHTSGTDMGTDWRDNDPQLEPAVEIYQGDRQNYEMPGAPRSNSDKDSIGGWRPLGFVSLALQKGYPWDFKPPAITSPRTCRTATCG